MTTLHYRITFTEPILGTAPNNEDIYRDFIGSKAPDAPTVEEEVAAIGADEYVEKGITVFPRDAEGRPFIWDYQIKGFYKDACSMLSRLTGKDPETGKKKKAVNESGKLTAYKKVIDGLVFPQPRQIPITFDGEIGLCQRPLRAQTAQGERHRLTCSIKARLPDAAYTALQQRLRADGYNTVQDWLADMVAAYLQEGQEGGETVDPFC